MPHKIEAFVGDCPLCEKILNEIEIGKCAKCELIVYNLSKSMPLDLMKRFNIKVVPTIIIDRKIKIEGRPKIPFICSDETYKYFKENYSLSKSE
ncbi:MAG: thioredoxin family protein [Candidatus Aenigmatarchaeota archaeon]